MTFQRIGSVSNAQVGASFEEKAAQALTLQRIAVNPVFPLSLGVDAIKKTHRFDLGSTNPPVVVECKSHTWTRGGNTPSAKITVWNETMYYFSLTPPQFRCILFVLRDFSPTRGCTLAEYYLRNFAHLVPSRAEIWEYDESTGAVNRLSTVVTD